MCSYQVGPLLQLVLCEGGAGLGVRGGCRHTSAAQQLLQPLLHAAQGLQSRAPRQTRSDPAAHLRRPPPGRRARGGRSRWRHC